MTFTIRATNDSDSAAISDVHTNAFSSEEQDVVAALAIELVRVRARPPVLSWVAEFEGEVLGHIVFSPVFCDALETWTGYILSPLGVREGRQGAGVGSSLVRYGLDQLTQMGADAVFVYGDPNYYERFGFSVQTAESFLPPYSLEHPTGWQATSLNDREAFPGPTTLSCVPPLMNAALW